MLKYYKKFIFSLLKSEFAESNEVASSIPTTSTVVVNYEKIKSYLEWNAEYKKEDMKDLWKKLSPEEQNNLQQAYEATAIAKAKLTELTSYILFIIGMYI